jgi:hypothetical protein
METFEQFSAVLSPELAVLNLTATRERRVLACLYGFAEQRIQIEQKRRGFIDQLKQLGPRLRKYKQVATALKNSQTFLEKALTLWSELPQPSEKAGPVFPHLLDGANDMLDEARQNLENSRRFIVGFEIPVLLHLSKKQQKVGDLEISKSFNELNEQWKQDRGSATYFPASSLEEWLENMGGTASYGLPSLPDTDPLKHLRAKAADHWFIEQADSFLRKHTPAGPTLRIKIVAKALLAAFKESGDNIDMVKTVLDRAAKPKPMKIRRVNPVSKTAPTF